MSGRGKRLIFLGIFFQTLAALGQDNIDVIHYRFDLILNDSSDVVVGRAEVRVRFLQPTDSFRLDLTMLNRSGTGMKVDSVVVSKRRLDFRQENDQIVFKTGGRKKTNDSTIFTIDYHGVPSGGLIISRNKYGDRTFFADNWPNRAHNWIPCKDELNDKASFEFFVTAPAQYRVISNGRLEEERLIPGKRQLTHWSEDVALPTKVMVIGVARFAVKQYEDSSPDTPVSAWVYPQDSVTGFRNYSPAPSIVKFFTGYIGPYPYNKLANVQSKTIFGGMENASAIFYYEQSAELDESVEDLLAHEIAHQWFGDMVSEKGFAHLWLSEGFATCLTNIYLESRYGTDSMNKRLNDDREKVINFAHRSNAPVVDSVSSLMNLLNENSYQKGGWVLHMLRREIGDSLFHGVIKSFYDRYKGKNADTHDLQRLAEEITHKDMEQFFKQWLYEPGIPRLQIRWHYEAKTRRMTITVTQLQKQTVFQFPLEIRLQSGSQSTIKRLSITKQSETFTFSSDQTINKVVADPNTSLLFEGKTEVN